MFMIQGFKAIHMRYFMLCRYVKRQGLSVKAMDTNLEVNPCYMVVSQIRKPQYRPQYTIVLIMGTPKMAPLIVGNPHISCDFAADLCASNLTHRQHKHGPLQRFILVVCGIIT